MILPRLNLIVYKRILLSLVHSVFYVKKVSCETVTIVATFHMKPSLLFQYIFLAKIIRPEDVCNKLTTSKSMCSPIYFLALSTTTIVPSSK